MHESAFIDIHANRTNLRNAASIVTTRQRMSRNGVLAIHNHSNLVCSMDRFFNSYPPAVVNQTTNNNSVRNTNRRNSYSSNGIIKQKPIVSELSELNRAEDKINLDKSIDKMQRYSSIIHRKTSPRTQSRRKRYKPSYNLPDQLDCGLNTATRQDVTGQNMTEQISASNHNPNNRIIDHQTMRSAAGFDSSCPVLIRTVDPNDETHIQSQSNTNIGEYRRDNELQPNSLPEAAISLIRSGHNEHNVRSALTRFYQTRGKSYPLIEFTYLRFYVICQTYISNLHYGHNRPTLSDLTHVLFVEMSCEIDEE
ncbi:hypothetical protein AM593_03620, partial [Mytilus galloprovincialis]